MDPEINVKVNYVGFTRRTVAEVLDCIILYFPLLILILSIALQDNNEIYAYLLDETKQSTYFYYEIFASALCTVLEILMITKLGGTPGKLLLWHVYQRCRYI